MGIIFYSMEDYQKAEEYFRKALPIFEKVLGNNHLYTKQAREALETLMG